MPFPEDGHMSGQSMMEAYVVCDIFLYIYVHLLVLISHNMRCLYGKISCNIQRDNFLNILDGSAVKKSTVLLF